MVQRVSTVAFEGVEVRPVDVQVQVAPGMPAFTVVGLPDKAVSEARERVRSAMIASGLALPARRITVNLAPADLPKEGNHYDLPIALGQQYGPFAARLQRLYCCKRAEIIQIAPSESHNSLSRNSAPDPGTLGTEIIGAAFCSRGPSSLDLYTQSSV